MKKDIGFDLFNSLIFVLPNKIPKLLSLNILFISVSNIQDGSHEKKVLEMKKLSFHIILILLTIFTTLKGTFITQKDGKELVGFCVAN